MGSHPNIPPASRSPKLPPTPVSDSVLDAKERERKRLITVMGRKGTILTSPAGAAGTATLGTPAALGGGY